MRVVYEETGKGDKELIRLFNSLIKQLNNYAHTYTFLAEGLSKSIAHLDIIVDTSKEAKMKALAVPNIQSIGSKTKWLGTRANEMSKDIIATIEEIEEIIGTSKIRCTLCGGETYVTEPSSSEEEEAWLTSLGVEKCPECGGKGFNEVSEKALDVARDLIQGLKVMIKDQEGQDSSLSSEELSLVKKVAYLRNNVNRLREQVISLQTEKVVPPPVSEMSVKEVKEVLTSISGPEPVSAPVNFAVGSVLTTLSGSSGNKVGPAFHIPAGHVRVVAQLSGLGSPMRFFIYLYKVGSRTSVLNGTTENAGEWVGHAYDLEEGDYYLRIGSIALDWQVTVYEYHT